MAKQSIVDLRDMPVFGEEADKQSLEPVHGPKRLDGLSSTTMPEQEPKETEKPWRLPEWNRRPIIGIAAGVGVISLAALLNQAAHRIVLRPDLPSQLVPPTQASSSPYSVQTLIDPVLVKLQTPLLPAAQIAQQTPAATAASTTTAGFGMGGGSVGSTTPGPATTPVDTIRPPVTTPGGGPSPSPTPSPPPVSTPPQILPLPQIKTPPVGPVPSITTPKLP
jgi:hypothetical protein